MTLLKKGLFHRRDAEDAEFYPVLGYRFEFLRYSIFSALSAPLR